MALAKTAQTSNLDGFRISQEELKDLLHADDEIMEDSNDLAVEMEVTPDDDQEEEVLQDGAEISGEIEIVSPDGEVLEEKEFDFKLDAVPGAEDQSDIPEPEVEEEESDPWKCTPENFFESMEKIWNNVPKHNGKEISGLVRAKSYLEDIVPVINSVLRNDKNGVLDVSKVEEIRDEVLKGIERIGDRIQKIESHKRPPKKKKRADLEYGIVKEAQKSAPFTVVVPLLHSYIARTCINSHVSAGHNIEDSFKKLAKFYDLDKREVAEVTQLILDMGFPLQLDRGRIGQDVDRSSSDNFDWAANYLA